MAGFLLALLIGSQSLDSITTAKLLQQPRYYESNRFLPAGPTGIILTKAAMTTGVVVVAWKLGKDHPKLRLVLLAIPSAVGLAAGLHNLRLGHP